MTCPCVIDRSDELEALAAGLAEIISTNATHHILCNEGVLHVLGQTIHLLFKDPTELATLALYITPRSNVH